MTTPTAGIPIHIRDARDDDFDSIAAIYAHHVLHGVATFEETPPDAAQMRARCTTTLDQGLPWLVAERAGVVIGYAYAGLYHTRAAWRFTIEDSIYVAHDCVGAGVGKGLLGALLERCQKGPWRQMVAVIGDSGNAGSIALHRSFGFEFIGALTSVGFKHGRWIDVPIMQRALGAGDASKPA